MTLIFEAIVERLQTCQRTRSGSFRFHCTRTRVGVSIIGVDRIFALMWPKWVGKECMTKETMVYVMVDEPVEECGDQGLGSFLFFSFSFLFFPPLYL